MCLRHRVPVNLSHNLSRVTVPRWWVPQPPLELLTWLQHMNLNGVLLRVTAFPTIRRVSLGSPAQLLTHPWPVLHCPVSILDQFP